MHVAGGAVESGVGPAQLDAGGNGVWGKRMMIMNEFVKIRNTMFWISKQKPV